jgi:hypothetical protein
MKTQNTQRSTIRFVTLKRAEGEDMRNLLV